MNLPRNSKLWGPAYLRDRCSRLLDFAKPSRVWLTIADHYEPLWQTGDEGLGRQRVLAWEMKWPEIAARHTDSIGNKPRYSFFFPEEEYRPQFLDPLAKLASQDIADVEVHIHHDGDTREKFIEKMSRFIETLHVRHGLLRRINDKVAFGFIHGNWALDNSRPDGRWCGLNDEITILRDLGCYADFTMPSGDSPTQARTVNKIYWAKDDPARPKSYDTGIEVTPGSDREGDLLMITGPLGIRWAERLIPRMEYGEIAANDPPTEYRVRKWLDLAPRIGSDIFIKLHTHGTQEKNSTLLLSGGLDKLFSSFSAECAHRGLELRFASAWEMYLRVEEIRNRVRPKLIASLRN